MTKFSKALLAVLFLSAQSVAAQDAAKDDLTDILNQLEDNLLSEGKMSDSIQNEPTAETKYNTGSSRFVIDPFAKDAIENISKLVNQLESRTKDLEAATLDLQAELSRNSTLNNITTLSVDPSIKTEGSLIGLIVKVDGIEIYNEDRSSGLWATNGIIPIYKGPMEVGNHNVEFFAQVKHTKPNKLKGLNSKISQINESFPITIPEGKSRPEWNVGFESSKQTFKLSLASNKAPTKKESKK